MSAFPGTDRFAIRRRLGSGGFGVVYEAFDAERQSLVALKVLHDAKDSIPWDISLLKREFRALAGLAHPNLVNLYEVMSHGPEWFFTMELVEGKTFLEHLCPDGRPAADYGLVRALMRQLAEGLWVLHRAGKLHRDLKPSHIRIGPGGRLVLLDYGFTFDRLARGFAAPQAGSQGNQAYMAPERIGGHAPSEAGDWYSAGVMLYQALTGSLPFPGDTLSTLIEKMRGNPPAPDLLEPGTPPDLSALCMELLARKPDLRPEGDQILGRLGAAIPASPARPAPLRRQRTSRLLIGREAELAALGRSFEASQQGKTVVAFVHGASGMGKSYLLRRFKRRLKRDEPRTVVLAGRCPEQGAVPFKTLDILMEDLGGYLERLPGPKAAQLLPRNIPCLARLFPALQGVEAITQAGSLAAPAPDPQELRRRAFGALRELLVRVGTRYPLVLVIEDFQWADPESAAVFSNLLRDPDPPSMLAVFSTLTEAGVPAPPARAFQERLEEEGTEVVEITLGKIPEAESRALAMALLGSNRPSAVAEGAWIAQESGGDPLFIGELTRHLRSGMEVPSGPEGHTLDAYIQSRVRSLPEPSRRLLETLALAGHPVEWETLSRACGLDPASLEALTPLRAGHLIRARGGQGLPLEPYHDRIRNSVLRDFPADRAREAHHALALALEQAPMPDAQALSQHFQAAGIPAKAGQYALAAAEQAVAALAFGRAAEGYRRALRFKEPRGQEQVEIMVKLGNALAGAGLGAKAAQVYLEVMLLVPPAEALRLQRRASEEYFRSGRFDQGEAALAAVMDQAGMKLVQHSWSAWAAERYCRLNLWIRGYGFTSRPESSIPKAALDRIDLCWAAAMGFSAVDHVRGAGFHARHLFLSLRAGEPFRIVRALALETIYTSFRGNRSLKATQRIQDTTLALAEQLGHPNPVSRALVAAGTAALMQGRWKASMDLLERAETILRDNCTGLDFELHLAQYYALLARLKIGTLRDMEIRLAARIQAAQDKGDLLAVTNLRIGILPHIHLAHDEPARALRELQVAIAAWSTAGFHLQHYHALVSRVEILLYGDDPGRALAVLAAHWPLLGQTLLPQVQSIRVDCLELRARAALALALKGRDQGRRAALLASANRDIQRIEAERVAYGEALALRLQALEGLAQGRPDEAGALLFQAELAFQACDMALHAMVVRHRRGRLEGPPGAEQMEAADRWMRGQRIANPTRYVAMHLPG